MRSVLEVGLRQICKPTLAGTINYVLVRLALT